MKFDKFSVGFLTTNVNAPQRSVEEDDVIQDQHMSHLADLHDAGLLLAAGPLSNDQFRGMLLFEVDAESAMQLMASDPAVKAGWFNVEVIPWMVPSGALQFASTTFPRSMREASS
jgi:uncharacterized protein YciI